MRGLNWIVLYAALLHAAWGTSVAIDPHTCGATAVAAVCPLVGHREPLVAAMLLAVAALAFRALWLAPGWARSLCLMPQQFVLLVSAGGAILAMTTQHYADGVPRPFAFIFADQLHSVLVALFHSFALMELPWTRSSQPSP